MDFPVLVPKLSIGMPVYNGEEFLSGALDSLLAQTWKDFELVISDNASTDDTAIICQAYARRDSRIRYVRQEENLGAYANFYFVLHEAKAEYFMWAAADDLWDPRWIELLLPVAIQDKCIAFGTVQTMDSSGAETRHIANRRNLTFAGIPLIRRMKFFLQPSILGKANPVYGIYPKHFITDAALSIFSENVIGGDMLFLHELLKSTEIKTCNKVIFCKRQPNTLQESEESKLIKSNTSSFFNNLDKARNILRQLTIFEYFQNCTYSERFLYFLSLPYVLAINLFFNIKSRNVN